MTQTDDPDLIDDDDEPAPTKIDLLQALGFSERDAWLLDTCGLEVDDLRGWGNDDAVTIASAINHQGLDSGMAQYLFQHHQGDVSAAFEEMAEDGDE